MDPAHVAVEGPPGVGKTALARRLARHWSARAVLEDARNPFLEPFLEQAPGAAFQCQAFFLLTRYKQQQALQQGELFRHRTVTDLLFQRDRIYAYLTLDRDDLAVYEKLYGVLVEQLPRPDLVIYLQASDDVLMHRLTRASPAGSAPLSPEYVSELNKAYDHFFFHHSETPLLAVNTSNIDLAVSRGDFEGLLRQVEQLQGGTRYYVPD